MKHLDWAIHFPATAVVLGLVSCAAVNKMGEGSLALVQKTTAATTSKVSQISSFAADTIHPPRVKVVEVREKDLKKLPTGKEQALAYQSTHKRGFWFFHGPVDFKEPNLPEPGGEMDGSLLPPKAP